MLNEIKYIPVWSPYLSGYGETSAHLSVCFTFASQRWYLSAVEADSIWAEVVLLKASIRSS